MKRILVMLAATITMWLTGCSGDNMGEVSTSQQTIESTVEDNEEEYDYQIPTTDDGHRLFDELGCVFTVPGDWLISPDDNHAEFFKDEDDSESIPIYASVRYCLLDIPDWERQYDLYLRCLEKKDCNIIESGLYNQNGIEGYFAEYEEIYEGNETATRIIEYVLNANNRGTVHLYYDFGLTEGEEKYLSDFYEIIDKLDVSGVPEFIDYKLEEWYEGYTPEEMEESRAWDAEAIEEAEQTNEHMIW